MPDRADDATIIDADRASAGQTIDRYRLVQPLGEGGFGSVWLAEQTEPVKRRVALKIIKLGMDTRQVIARFEAERQALAMMDHPGIAKVFDAGSTETGRPYFVMEHIKGVPIVEYCDTQKLDTRARLDLFVKVCEAIQHAHQKGIIHRDIKPSNVLVTLEGDKPAPKVIDFGIAKATNTELTQKTLMTEQRQMIGTPAYMSPEQAEMSGLDVDTRSDLYSLGVLLYELLTGATPFDSDELASKGYAEMARIIREVEPARPSTRLSAMGPTAEPTANARRLDAKRLRLTLRGDLDWIVMKCLEKDRTRRYESANGLAEDIGRHLDNLPVRAGPPGLGYRCGKFVRRNRAAVGATAAGFALLLAGLAGTSYGLVEARQHGRAAEDSERVAQLELARSLELNEFLKSVLESVNPSVARDRDTTVLREVLEATVQRLNDGALADQPVVAADLRATLAQVYTAIGDRARGLEILAPALARAEAQPPAEAARYVSTFIVYAAELSEERRLTEASEVLERVIAWHEAGLIPNDDAHTALSMFGSVLSRMGHLNRSIEMQQASLGLRREIYGNDHANVGSAVANLAGPLQDAGRYEESLALLDEAMAIFEAQDKPLPVHRAILLNNRAGVLLGLERQAEAEAEARQALTVGERIWPPTHPSIGMIRMTLAETLREGAHHDGALAEYRAAYAIYRDAFGPEHASAALACIGEALTLGELGSPAAKAGELGAALEAIATAYGADHTIVSRQRERVEAFFQRHAAALRGDPAVDAWNKATNRVDALVLTIEPDLENR